MPGYSAEPTRPDKAKAIAGVFVVYAMFVAAALLMPSGSPLRQGEGDPTVLIDVKELPEPQPPPPPPEEPDKARLEEGAAGKKAERGGAVLLQLLINERGGLDHVDVVCAAPAFEQSAVESMRGMKFRPARDKHGPVKSYMWVEIAYGRGYPCASVPD